MEILFVTTFLIHLALTLYASYKDTHSYIIEIQRGITLAFDNLGFEWKGKGAYVVTASLLSSFAVNVIRIFLQCFIFGWPDFKTHDRNSLLKASILFIFYGLITYFSVGFFGEKYSSRNIDVFDVVFIAIATFIVGMFSDLANNLISGFYSVHLGDKA